MVEFMDIAREYGLWAAVSVMLFPWVYSIDKRSRKTKSDLEAVHVGCHIPVDTIIKIQEELDEVKEDNQEQKIRSAVVESSLSEIKADVKAVLLHLQIKGLDS